MWKKKGHDSTSGYLDSCYIYQFGCFHVLLVRMLLMESQQGQQIFFVNLAVEKEKLTSRIVKARCVRVTTEQIRNIGICHV